MSPDLPTTPKWFDSKPIVVVSMILFFPLGLYALWKNSAFSTKTKWTVTGIVALLVCIGGLVDEPDARGPSSSGPTAAVLDKCRNTTDELGTQPKTVEDLLALGRGPRGEQLKECLAEAATEVLSETGVIGVETILQWGGDDEGGYAASIKYRASGRTRYSIMSDARKLVKRLSTDPSLSDAKIYYLWPHLKLVDKYGNESVGQVGKFILRKAVADRINWENMQVERFEEILKTDGYFKLFGVYESR